MMPNHDENRIDIALLNQAIRQLTTTLLETNTDIRELRNELRKTLDEHEKRLQQVEKDQTRMSERMTLWQLGQAAFTTSVGGLVAFLRR